MPFTRKMPKEYSVKDMPIGAQFMSSLDCPSLKLLLKPLESRYDEAQRTHVVVDGTSVRIEFTNGVYVCENSELFKLLVGCSQFRKVHRGFDIDKNDPTGFWRQVGIIEEETVTICKKVRKDVDVAQVNAMAVANELQEKYGPDKTPELNAAVEACEQSLAEAEKTEDAIKIRTAKAALTRAKNALDNYKPERLNPLAELRYGT